MGDTWRERLSVDQMAARQGGDTGMSKPPCAVQILAAADFFVIGEEDIS